MRAITLLVAAAASNVLVACSEDVPEGNAPSGTSEIQDASPSSVRDVQYFLDNPEERRALRQECRNNPGVLQNSAECINADEANKQARVRRTRELLGN